MIARYGEGFHSRVQLAFERAGLVYNPPPEVVSNSRAALRLTELARAQGKHGLAHDRLMAAYWEEATDIGDTGVLHAVAAELELEGAEAAIEADLFGEDVRRGTAEAQAIGINAIPAFVFDRRLIVLGAQPDHVLDEVIGRLDEPEAQAT